MIGSTMHRTDSQAIHNHNMKEMLYLWPRQARIYDWFWEILIARFKLYMFLRDEKHYNYTSKLANISCNRRVSLILWPDKMAITIQTMKSIFGNENRSVVIPILLGFVTKGPIHNESALIYLMAWHRINYIWTHDNLRIFRPQRVESCTLAPWNTICFICIEPNNSHIHTSNLPTRGFIVFGNRRKFHFYIIYLTHTSSLCCWEASYKLFTRFNAYLCIISIADNRHPLFSTYHNIYVLRYAFT